MKNLPAGKPPSVPAKFPKGRTALAPAGRRRAAARRTSTLPDGETPPQVPAAQPAAVATPTPAFPIVGIGLDAAQQALLFNSFAQADSSTTRKYGGIGIGLSICKRLAELMGGKVGADGTPNAGSTFWFSARLLRGNATAAAMTVAHGLPAGVVGAAPAAVAAATEAEPLTADALKALLDQLDALLAQSDIAAITLFDEHAAALRAALGEPGARLGHEIRQFAFEAARKTVQTLRSGVPGP